MTCPYCKHREAHSHTIVIENGGTMTIDGLSVGEFNRKQDTRTAERSEGVKESDPGTPRACETCRATCDLAASEIPGFGTNRDRHRCPKLHRDKPTGPCPECGTRACAGGR